jgi:hypothetical protein
VTMVLTRSSGPRPSGVAWVSTALCITIVRLSGQVNSVRKEYPGPAQPECHVHYQYLICAGSVVDDQVTEGVWVAPGAVPRIQPVGDNVLGFAKCLGVRDDGADRFRQRRPRG